MSVQPSGLASRETVSTNKSLPSWMPSNAPFTRLFSRAGTSSETRSLGELPHQVRDVGEADGPEGSKVNEFYAASFWLSSQLGESDVLPKR